MEDQLLRQGEKICELDARRRQEYQARARKPRENRASSLSLTPIVLRPLQQIRPADALKNAKTTVICGAFYLDSAG